MTRILHALRWLFAVAFIALCGVATVVGVWQGIDRTQQIREVNWDV